MPVEHFTVNLDGKTRRETLHGRDYIVKPAAVGAETVMNGSEGPGFYPGEEWRDSVPTWDHKPLMYTHPQDAGKFTTACDPAVLETSQIGIVLNTGYDDKLRMEAWFEEALVKSVDPNLLTALDANVPIECSTGVRLGKQKQVGVHNGMTYQWIARNLKGDHLAVLPVGRGAYSVAMGGGIGVTNAMSVLNKKYTKRERRAMVKDGRAMKDGSVPITNEADLRQAVAAIGRHKNPAVAKRHIIARARALGVTSTLPREWQLAADVYLAANELTLSDVRDKVRDSLVAKFGKPGREWYGYILEMYLDRIVFEKDEKLWEIGYSIAGDAVTVGPGQAKEVKKVYQPVAGGERLATNAGDVLSNNDKETMMAFDKVKHVAGLIGNGWADADKAWLEGLPDDKLAKILPEKKEIAANAQNASGAGGTPGVTQTSPTTIPAPSGDSVQRPGAGQTTFAQIVANLEKEDPSAARMFKQMGAHYVKSRQKMAEGIKAKTDKYSDTVLANMDDEVLEATYELLQDGRAGGAGGGPFGTFFGQTGTVVGNVGGGGGGAGNGNREPLGMPSSHVE